MPRKATPLPRYLAPCLREALTDADFRGLRKLRDAAGKQFAAGVVLYDGTAATGFGDNLFAMPLRSLWEDS